LVELVFRARFALLDHAGVKLTLMMLISYRDQTMSTLPVTLPPFL